MDSFKNLTTFKVGGTVARVERPESAEVFLTTLGRLAGTPFMILGGGSNVLVNDAAYAGTVVIPSFSRIEFTDDTVTADAGASWDALVHAAVSRGLWGIENLSSIPGTVGGAVVANIGAYGAALSDTLVSVDVYDVAQGLQRTLSKDECESGYRMSIFKKEPERYAILRAHMRLCRTPRPNLAYRDLAEHFAGEAAPTIFAIRAAVIGIRAAKFPNLTEFGTAGSFFLNPIITEGEAARIRTRFPGMPLFSLPEGGIKVPLAWIFDHATDVRGMREGGAFIWPAQLLVIATEQDARARDVRTLAERIAQEVKEKTEIEIFTEVRIL